MYPSRLYRGRERSEEYQPNTRTTREVVKFVSRAEDDVQGNHLIFEANMLFVKNEAASMPVEERHSLYEMK